MYCTVTPNVLWKNNSTMQYELNTVKHMPRCRSASAHLPSPPVGLLVAAGLPKVDARRQSHKNVSSK